MKSVNSTPSSAHKPKRSHLGEFLPLYKKFEANKAELNKSSETFEKHDIASSKVQFGSPNHQLPSSGKKAMKMSLMTIDGSCLNGIGGNTTPLNESRVTSTPQSSKKSAKANKKPKNIPSEDNMTANDVSLTNKSQKRSKSVSFLIEENEKTLVKKTKPDDSPDDSNDNPQKVKNKKTKKSEKENKDEETKVNEPVNKELKKKKLKSAHKSKPEEREQSVADIDAQGDGMVNNKKIIKERKKQLDKLSEMDQVRVKSRKAKKQKHQHMDEDVGEPAPKSPKTEFLDNLENLNLGDNTHTLTNWIDEMAVVDKEKKKKKRKTENRDKKHNETGNNQENQNKTDKVDNKQEQTENNDQIGDVAQNEKRKWDAKRWNKHQFAERARNTTVNVDNLPVSLLKGNFKKGLIDHFSKYGKTINVGEPVIQNENEPNPVFTTKVYFDSAEATVEALEMDGSELAGNKLRVSAMRPMTETSLVIRIYDHPKKLTDKDVITAFGEVGLIRSIKPVLRKKKSMTTAFVEFDGPEAVERAMQKSAKITIGGKQVMASPFTARTHIHDQTNNKKDKIIKHKKKGANKAHGPKNVKSEK